MMKVLSGFLFLISKLIKFFGFIPSGVVTLFRVEKHYHYHGGVNEHKDG